MSIYDELFPGVDRVDFVEERSVRAICALADEVRALRVFQSERDEYNAKIDAYNALVDEYNAKIDARKSKPKSPVPK